MRRRHLLTSFAVVPMLALGQAPASAAVSALARTGVAATDGGVYALARSATRTYLGGTFTTFGGLSRQNVAAATSAGGVDTGFVARTNGKVDALALSPDGRTLYLGGVFTTVNGVARSNLAAVDAVTGALRSGFRADVVGVSGEPAAVRALAAVGSRLYVGGKYTGIAGTSRKRLAAVNLSTGALDAAFNPQPNRPVNEVKVSPNGAVVYAGGAFTVVGGQSRTAVAALTAATGAATGWVPAVTGGNAVTIALSPDGATLYTGTERNTVFAFPTSGTGSVRPRWTQVGFDGNTQAIVASSSEVYLGGHFVVAGSPAVSRPYFASLRASNGALTSWSPQAKGGALGVWALAADSANVYAGGLFTSVGGRAQRGYAVFAGTP